MVGEVWSTGHTSHSKRRGWVRCGVLNTPLTPRGEGGWEGKMVGEVWSSDKLKHNKSIEKMNEMCVRSCM